MFGETMPIEAVNLLANSAGAMPIAEMRAKLLEIAACRPTVDDELVALIDWLRNHRGVGRTRTALAADRITDLMAKLERYRRVVSAFVAKYIECEPHISDAFLHRQLRCGQYTGPTIEKELHELKALSDSTEGEL